MTHNMANSQSNHIKQLSKHTVTTINCICNGIVSLCQHLLATSHILLGQFTIDPLEKEFRKLRQRSGGTYFINVQQCIEKQTSLLLNQNVNIDAFDGKPGHQYTSCEEGSEIFDTEENLESSPSDKIKMAAGGYIIRNDNQSSEYETYFYYEKYGKYTNSTIIEN